MLHTKHNAPKIRRHPQSNVLKTVTTTAVGIMSVLLMSMNVHAASDFSYKGQGSRSPTPVTIPKTEIDPHHWMSIGYTHRANTSLRNICIPGTHDSGTYGINGIDENISQTQELTVADQLASGYRYFDLRIKMSGGEFKMHHGPSISVPARDVFNDLGNFANANPAEILFVHIQNVDSMNNDEHYRLRDELVLPHLGTRLAPRSLGNDVTFEKLWNINKNVVLIWGGGNFADLSPNYWNQGQTMSSHWLDTGDSNDLVRRLRDRVQDDRGGRFYVAQMILNPTTTQLIFPPYFGSIEDLTDDKLDHGSMVYDLDMHAKRSNQRMNIAMVDFAGHRFYQYAYEACMDVNDIEPHYFSLQNKENSALCLDVENGNTANDANVRIWECNSSAAESWTYEHSTGMLHSKLDNTKCLDNGGQNWNLGKVVLWDCNHSIDNMRFDFYDDSIRVRQNPNIALDASGTGTGANVYQYEWHGKNNQRWEKIYEPPVYFQLVNEATGLCMDVADNNTHNGADVRSWECNDSLGQRWYYDHQERFFRSKLNPNKCLDNGAEPWNNGKIVLWNCINDRDNTRFDWVNGVIRSAIDNNFVIDAYGPNIGDNVGQWEFLNGNNQRWHRRD